MPDVKRTIKVVTEQRVIDKPSGVEGFPLRSWSVEMYVEGADGTDHPANMFESVTYKLHPTFPKPTQTFKKPPFRIEEEGWGEFDYHIVCKTAHKGVEHTLSSDLNFQEERYESKHTVTFKNPKPDLLALLAESGPTGEHANGVKGASGRGDASKKRRKDKNQVDMEKLADGLQRLGEDDLLTVVQMVHDGKTADTYTKNDVENGEFHVDLFTLPDDLVRKLWDFTAARVDGMA